MKKRLPIPADPETPLQRQITRRMEDREIKNLQALADAAGRPVTYDVVREIFRKSTIPSGDKLAAIADALDCTIDELLERNPRTRASINTSPSVATAPIGSGDKKLDDICGQIPGIWEGALKLISGHEFDAAAALLHDLRNRCDLAKALCVFAADDERKRGRDI